jgi:hypothetical protein
MPYNSIWPPADYDQRLDQALDIAMGYLQARARATNFDDVQKAAALIILVGWQHGVKHPIRLANAAIVQLDADPQVVDLRSVAQKSRRK